MKEKKKYFAVLIIMILGIVLFLKSGSPEKKYEQPSIERETAFGEDKKIELEIVTSEAVTEIVEVNVPKKKYTEEECEKLFNESSALIIKTMLNGNEDLTEVKNDLYFFSELTGYPFSYSFEKDSEIFTKTGEIITGDECVTTIGIAVSYEDFYREISLKARVVPDAAVKARVIKRKILAKLEDSESVTENEILLPTEVDGIKVSYKIPARKRNGFLLLIGPIGGVAVLLGSKRDELKEKERRKEEILREYPALMQKMALYLASGMTIRKIWAMVYEEGIKKNEKSPLYLEMGITVNEIKSGISEGVSYKRFGERTETNELIRFTALLCQNLKKGTSKLKDLIEEEVRNAYLIKKQRAIKLGEQAGTKLLFPMMLLLVEVLLLIMVPAFLSV